MVVEPRLHFDEGLERLTQFRLTDGMDVVILSAGRAAKAGCSRDPAIDIHFFALEHRVLLRDALSLGIIVDPLHWLLRVPVGVIGRSGAGVSGEALRARCAAGRLSRLVRFCGARFNLRPAAASELMPKVLRSCFDWQIAGPKTSNRKVLDPTAADRRCEQQRSIKAGLVH